VVACLFIIISCLFMKKHTARFVVIIAALAGAIWYFFFRPHASLATQAAVSQSATDGINAAVNNVLGVNHPAATVVSTGSMTGTGAGLMDTSDAQVDATVSSYFNTLSPANKQQAYAQAVNMHNDTYIGSSTPVSGKSYYEGIYHMVVDPGWGKALYADFWNKFRTRYHVLDGTYA